MADLISRQDAINAAIEAADIWDGCYSPERERMITERLKKVPATWPGWILCSERLPEEDGQYLITVKYVHSDDNYKDVYAEHGEWYDGRWDMFYLGHCGKVEDIIAWMPLPESYKEEDDG